MCFAGGALLILVHDYLINDRTVCETIERNGEINGDSFLLLSTSEHDEIIGMTLMVSSTHHSIIRVMCTAGALQPTTVRCYD